MIELCLAKTGDGSCSVYRLTMDCNVGTGVPDESVGAGVDRELVITCRRGSVLKGLGS